MHNLHISICISVAISQLVALALAYNLLKKCEGGENPRLGKFTKQILCNGE